MLSEFDSADLRIVKGLLHLHDGQRRNDRTLDFVCAGHDDRSDKHSRQSRVVDVALQDHELKSVADRLKRIKLSSQCDSMRSKPSSKSSRSLLSEITN